MSLAVASAASAATVVTFVAVRSGDTLTVSNPHASPVSGQLRLVSDAGTLATPPVRFSLPAQGSQLFSSFGSVTSPAILAVESSDVVKLSSAPLRVGYAERQLTLAVRFNPDIPDVGSLVLGILNGLVRVNIYEHPTSVTPIVSRTFGSAGEQVTRLRYQDLLPPGVAIRDGYATVMLLSGQAVATAVNAPTRRRSAGHSAAAPPVLSVTGGPACEFATGVRASVSPVAGATYRWTLVNATSQGALTSSALDLVLGGQGYASFALNTVVNGSVSTVEANIAIDDKPDYTSSSATSVTLGDDAVINWTLSGGAPTSQTISGTDFATVSLDPSATSYAYRPTATGPKTYALSADNACGTSGESGTYSVSAACTAPRIDSFTNSGAVCAGNPAQLTWATEGSGTVTIDHGVGTVSDSGSIAVSPSATTTYTITKTASCGSDSRTTSVTVTRPVITSLTASPGTVPGGGTSTITGNYTNGVSWTMSSSLDNSLSTTSGSGASPAVVTYTRDIAGGTDTITFTVNDACGNTTSQTTTICSAVGITPSGPTTFCQGGSVTLTAYAGTAYSWSTGATTASITVNATGTYSVTDTGGSGCTSTASQGVTVNPDPAAAVVPSNPTICNGASVDITANLTGTAPFTISWSNGNIQTISSGTVATLNVTPAVTTTYSVTNVTDANGCSAVGTGSVTVTVQNPPVITSFNAPASVAPGAGGTITFAYTDGTSYAFTSSLGNTLTPSGGNSTTGGSVNYNRDNAAGPDTITLTVTGPCGTTQDTRVINDPPVITNFTASPTSINFTETSALSFTIANGSTWSLSSSIGNGFSQSSGTGSGPFTITYSAANNEGTDTVTLTASGPGGASSATVTILVGAPRIVSFTATPTTIGFGETATLNFTIENGAWTLSSSIGNTFSQSSGACCTFTITYSANANTGADTVTLLVTRPPNTPPPLPPASATVTIQVNN